MDRRSSRKRTHSGLMILGFLSSTIYGCSTTGQRIPAALTEEVSVNSVKFYQTNAPGSDDFTKLLKKIEKKVYFGNFHAHHFMGAKTSKNNPVTLEEMLAPGECRAKKASFPEDDGRPCRDVVGEDGVVQVGVTVPPRSKLEDGSPAVIDYFKQACEYGTGPGKLDIHFVTPHTKNNQQDEGQIAASSKEENLLPRAALLKRINPSQTMKAPFYCGMGQEASSISAGNHINIFGQFKIASTTGQKPLFFHAGAFSELYPKIGERIRAGEKIMLQLNHPGVRSDLWFGDFSDEAAWTKKRKKEKLNDYGIDDFAPIGCKVGKLTGEQCTGVTGTTLTQDDLKATYANIRKVSGDPFRMIEVIPPSNGGGAEGEGSDEETPAPDAETQAFGATTNTNTTFRKVQNRSDANTLEEGVYDWIYYLAMGFKLAPTANQDNHFMNFGSATASRTGVIATDLREKNVLAALNTRKIFASEDVNARAVIMADTGQKKALMGDVLKTSAPSLRLYIAYQDLNPAGEVPEDEAEVRLYYYRATDPLNFGYRSKTADVFHTVGWVPSERENYKAVLPAPSAEGRSSNDLIPIRSGAGVRVNVPLEKGVQWIFAEIVQKGDLDKIWTAPIWIERK